MVRKKLPYHKKIYSSMVAILLLVSLCTGCLFSVTGYDHRTEADTYTSVDITISVEAGSSYSGNVYGVFAVLLPDSWSMEGGTYSGYATGTLTTSDPGAGLFERECPSGSGYRWAALVTEQIPSPNSDASITFEVTLKTGEQGHEWIDYRVIFTDALAFGENDPTGISFSPHIGNAYINVDAMSSLPEPTTYVPHTDTVPTFSAIDETWANATIVHIDPDKGGRFEFYTYLIADKTHLNIFIDAVGMDYLQTNTYMVLAFDTNNDNVLTPGVDVAIRITQNNYELIRYNGEFDLMRWSEVLDTIPMHDTMYVRGRPLPARAEWKSTPLNPVPHATYSLRIPFIHDLIGRPSPDLRYALLLYDQYERDYIFSLQSEGITLDTRSFLPESADARHMFTWGKLVFSSLTPPVNTWGIMYLMAIQALDESNAL